MCLAVFSSCNDNRQIKQDVAAATHMGRVRALELTVDATVDTLAVEKILLDIRSREHALRSQGHDRVADAYINSFLAVLDSVNPSLRRAIGQ